MKPLATLTAGMAIAGTMLGVAAAAHAGGPPNDGGGGGGAPAAAPGSCSDAALTVTNGPIESASTMRRVVVSFKNTSASPCHLVGYPDANLVTAAGGVLSTTGRRWRRMSSRSHRVMSRPPMSSPMRSRPVLEMRVPAKAR